MSKQVQNIIQAIAARYEIELHNARVAEIVANHPEWIEQEPELKAIFDEINRLKKLSASLTTI